MKTTTTLMSALFLATAACTSQVDSSRAPTPGQVAPAAQDVGAPAPAFASHQEAARASLATLTALATDTHYQALGFQSPDEARIAALGDGIAMYRLGLFPLRACRVGDDPRALLEDERAVMYPALVGGQVRSAIVVRERDGQWHGSSFGKAHLAQAVEAERQALVSSGEAEVASISLVEVPTLSATFLAFERSGRSMWTPLHDVSGTELRAGRTVAAAEVLAALQPLAIQYDETVPN